MDLLKRNASPILSEAWKAVDDEARRVLKLKLAARKLVDVSGPNGWTFAAVNTGVLRVFDAEPVEGVAAGLRAVQPLVELRAPLELELMELDSVSRGSRTPELASVTRAAERIAVAEDQAVFSGYGDAGIKGIFEVTPHGSIPFGDKPEHHLAAAVQATQMLHSAGIGGPYGLALGRDEYAALLKSADDGYPMIGRVRDVIGGPIVQADAIDGGALLSMRGGDFELTLGQDYSVGYVTADRKKVEMYIACSFTFRVLEPGAAVRLARGI